MIKQAAFVAFVASHIATSVVYASLPNFKFDSEEKQCWGLTFDFDRIRQISKDDITDLGRGFVAPDKMYAFNNEISVNQQGSSKCLFKRLRMKEKVQGIEVIGGDIVVSVVDCSPETAYAFGYGDDGNHKEINLASVPLQFVADLVGKTFSSIDPKEGFVPSLDANQAKDIIASYYAISKEKVGELGLKIFPSTEGDKLVYAGEAWVEKGNDIQFYDVMLSALNGEFLSVCKSTSAHHERIHGRLRGGDAAAQQDDRELVSCQSCANHSASITWTDEEVECDVNPLYLGNDGLKTICNKGTKSTGEVVMGPGVVESLHWGGAYDCNSKDRGCSAVELPACDDALSDVQFNVIETMKFNQEYLGIMGGFSPDAAAPVPSKAYVHYSNKYCNAFFTTQTNALYFGDCDCSYWSPLTSIDVVAHEYTHGVTSYTSELIYSYQSGGLNEAYSDITGATMEFYINDSKDTPDFNLGENLGGKILRFMEDPTKDTKSIDNVCSFTNDLNVHHTSGVLNKAFVKTVRACENNGCGGERDCVLYLGPLFMYANIHRLTSLSGYLDSGKHTCDVVDEFFSTRQPQTSCSKDQTKVFIQEGFKSVGIEIDGQCAATSPSCELPGTPPGAGVGVGCFARFKDTLSKLRPNNWPTLVPDFGFALFGGE